jgi:hypothetical protein
MSLKHNVVARNYRLPQTIEEKRLIETNHIEVKYEK